MFTCVRMRVPARTCTHTCIRWLDFPNVVFMLFYVVCVCVYVCVCVCVICVHLSVGLRDGASVRVCLAHGDELEELRIYVSG